MLRNTRTFERLKKMIMKGAYDKDELMLDMVDFLELGTLTEKEFSDLMELIELHPSTRMSFNDTGNLISDNTFLLLHKQIIKKVYTAEVVEQLVTDFKITDSITREQFKTLINLIDETYYPVVEEDNLPEIF